MKLPIAGLLTLSLALAACGESAEQDTAAPVDTAAAEEATLADAVAAADGPFAPKDDCGALQGFDSFRGQLRRAVTFQSIDGIAALSDPAVKLDFGGGSGIDTLKTRLTDDPALWDNMGEALALGCSTDSETSASMPWFFSNLPDGADAASTYLVTANDAPVYSDAAGTTPGDATISWDLVKLAGDGPAEDAEFVEVSTMDGETTGYVSMDNLRSALGLRVLANRGDDGWKVTGILSGD